MNSSAKSSSAWNTVPLASKTQRVELWAPIAIVLCSNAVPSLRAQIV